MQRFHDFFHIQHQILERYHPDYPLQLPIDVDPLRYAWCLIFYNTSIELIEILLEVGLVINEDDHGLVDEAFELLDEIYFVVGGDGEIWLLFARKNDQF